jgi:hypothetical protein
MFYIYCTNRRQSLKEFWIKGKRINLIKNKAAIRKQVERTIRKEIKFISSFFPYSIEKFHNPSLLYFQSIFLMENYQDNNFNDKMYRPGLENFETRDNGPGQRQSAKKVKNLIVGLELLSIGTAFHDFKSNGSLLSPDNHPLKKEKEYTLDLLFGDIFYSRAVIYLLKFEDHGIFDRILNSLKGLHESRLVLHRGISDMLLDGGDLSKFDNYVDLKSLIGANRLLEISLDISFELFCEKSGKEEKIKFSDLAKQIMILKTYDDLLKYIHSIKTDLSTEKISTHLTSEKNFTDRKLSDIISELDSGKFKSSIKALFDGLEN